MSAAELPKTPADQTATRQLLANLHRNGALNDAEHHALLGALREDLVNAVWATRELVKRESDW